MSPQAGESSPKEAEEGPPKEAQFGDRVGPAAPPAPPPPVLPHNSIHRESSAIRALFREETPEFGDQGEQEGRSFLMFALQVGLLSLFAVDVFVIILFDFFLPEPLMFSNLVDAAIALAILFFLGTHYVIDCGRDFTLTAVGFISLHLGLSLVSTSICHAGIEIPKCVTLEASGTVQSILFNGGGAFVAAAVTVYIAVTVKKSKPKEEPGALVFYSVLFWRVCRYLYLPLLFELTRMLTGKNTTETGAHAALAFGCAALSYVELLSRPSRDRLHSFLRGLTFAFCSVSMSVALVMYLITTAPSGEPSPYLGYILVMADAIIFVHCILYFRYHKYTRRSFRDFRRLKDVLSINMRRASSTFQQDRARAYFTSA